MCAAFRAKNVGVSTESHRERTIIRPRPPLRPRPRPRPPGRCGSAVRRSYSWAASAIVPMPSAARMPLEIRSSHPVTAGRFNH